METVGSRCLYFRVHTATAQKPAGSRHVQRNRFRSCTPGMRMLQPSSVWFFWFLVWNGGMDYGDYYWELYRGYYRDPFPHSLLSTRQAFERSIDFWCFGSEDCRSEGTDSQLEYTPKLYSAQSMQALICPKGPSIIMLHTYRVCWGV